MDRDLRSRAKQSEETAGQVRNCRAHRPAPRRASQSSKWNSGRTGQYALCSRNRSAVPDRRTRFTDV